MSTYGLSVLGADLKSLAQTAQAADAAGFDAVWASEFYSRSGSISMAAMANSTQNCRIGSSILYGVGRSPWCWPPRRATSTNSPTDDWYSASATAPNG